MGKSVETTAVPIRFTMEELAHLKECASSSASARFRNGKPNLSRYIREKVLSDTGYADTDLKRQLRDLQYELRKIGTNINQVARKINGGYIGSSEDLRELKEYLTQIEELFAEMRKAAENSSQKKGEG